MRSAKSNPTTWLQTMNQFIRIFDARVGAHALGGSPLPEHLRRYHNRSVTKKEELTADEFHVQYEVRANFK